MSDLNGQVRMGVCQFWQIPDTEPIFGGQRQMLRNLAVSLNTLQPDVDRLWLGPDLPLLSGLA